MNSMGRPSNQENVTGRKVMLLDVSKIDQVVGIGHDDEVATELEAVICDEVEHLCRRFVDAGLAEERVIELKHVMI